MDRRAADARSHSDGRSGNSAGGRPEGRRRGAAAGGHRRAAGRHRSISTDPAVTVELLRLNAVVGVKGTVDDAGQLTSVGITCALCHSSVDNSFAPGIGKRLDGWANTDLNVGAIVALSPALDDATKAEFRTWGPGKYDPRHHAFDGTNIIPLNSPSLPIVIPPIYGLKGVGFETFTGDGPISYWNSYVGVGQMGGHGSFSDPRIGLFDHADAGSRDAEAAGAARLSTEPAHARSLRRAASIATAAQRGKRSVPRRGAVQHVPSGAELHRRAERSGRTRAVPARSGGSRHGSRATRAHPRPASTGRRRCAGCCSTRRTSTTAARRICSPSSITTTAVRAESDAGRRRPRRVLEVALSQTDLRTSRS